MERSWLVCLGEKKLFLRQKSLKSMLLWEMFFFGAKLLREMLVPWIHRKFRENISKILAVSHWRFLWEIEESRKFYLTTHNHIYKYNATLLWEIEESSHPTSKAACKDRGFCVKWTFPNSDVDIIARVRLFSVNSLQYLLLIAMGLTWEGMVYQQTWKSDYYIFRNYFDQVPYINIEKHRQTFQ